MSIQLHLKYSTRCGKRGVKKRTNPRLLIQQIADFYFQNFGYLLKCRELGIITWTEVAKYRGSWDIQKLGKAVFRYFFLLYYCV